jgi:RNA polymerase sigma-70 factor (ECF subfamily)
LPREYAEVLTLKDLDGLTNADIAARLGISLEAAKIRLHRARKAMRAQAPAQFRRARPIPEVSRFV